MKPKFKYTILCCVCALLAFCGTFFVSNFFGFTSNAPIETREASNDNVIEFDDSVYVEEDWANKPSEGFSGGSGTLNDPYQISKPGELIYLSNRIISIWGWSKNKYFVLMNDIVLNDGYFEEDGTYHDGGDGILNSWPGIGSGSRYFHGNFDGNGYSVSGIYMNKADGGRGGLFTILDVGFVKNVHVKNSYIYTPKGYVGGVVGAQFASLIENCSFDGTITSTITKQYYFGGIVGQQGKNTKIINCVNYGRIYGYCHTGGIAGFSEGEISKCKNEGYVGLENFSMDIGGITASGRPTYCENYGLVTGIARCGGITGNRVAQNSTNYGKIKGETQIAGIVGSANGSIPVSDCKNFGYIESSKQHVGGIVGYSSVINILNCVNYGVVYGGSNYAGGIIGGAFGLQKAVIKQCINYGKIMVNASPVVGGIAGTAQSGWLITECENFGDIQTTASKHIVGYIEGCKIENCISMCFDIRKGKQVNQIYANDLLKFYINYRTGQIRIRKNNALSVFMGVIDMDLLENKDFQFMS